MKKELRKIRFLKEENKITGRLWSLYFDFIFNKFNKHFNLLTIDYFIKQSEIYPFWWRNYTWWDYNKKNPIYKDKWK